MKSNTLLLILFFVLGILIYLAVYTNSARGETAVCAEKNADALRVCASLRAESEIAKGNHQAIATKESLYALRDGADPEVRVLRLAVELMEARLTLADFGVTKQDLSDAVTRYYANKARRLNVHEMKDQRDINAAFSQLYTIYEKRNEVLLIARDEFEPFLLWLIGSTPREIY